MMVVRQCLTGDLMPYKLSVRIPDYLSHQLEAAVEERGVIGARTDIVCEALAQYFKANAERDSHEEMEARIAATLTRVLKDVMHGRNEVQLLTAMFDCYLRSYFMHTPPVPREAVDASAASAAARYDRLIRQIPEMMQGGGGVLTEFQQALQSTS